MIQKRRDSEIIESVLLNNLTQKIIHSAIRVHRFLGSGLLESAYEACLTHDLTRMKLKVEWQKGLPIHFANVRLECGYRVDLLVEKRIILEIKAIENVLPVHKAQLLSYLRLSRCKVGLLINFHVVLLRTGIYRVFNNFPDSLRTPR